MTAGKPPETSDTELSPAQNSRLHLAEAEASAAEALTMQGAWQTTNEEFIAYLTSGRASLTELDTYAAKLWHDRHAEEVAGLLVKGCQANVKRATAALINDDTAVADLLADILGEVYGGRLPVRVVTVSDDVKPNENGDPVLFILQSQAGKNDGGILSATLDLTFYRSPLFASLEGRKLEEACRKRGYDVSVSMRSPVDRDTYFEDPARVTVTRAFLAVPEMSHEPGDGQVSLLANSLSNSLRNAVTAPGRMPQLYASEESEGRARMERAGYKVVSRKVSNGDCRMVVEIAAKVWPDALLDGAPGALLREAVNGYVGSMTEAVGRVVAVEHLDVLPPKIGHASAYDPFVITAHLAVTYRVSSTS